MPSTSPRITFYISQELKDAIALWSENKGVTVSTAIGMHFEALLLSKEIFVIDPHQYLREQLETIAEKRKVSVDRLIYEAVNRIVNEETNA